MLEDVLMYAELTRTSKVNGDESSNDALHLADPVVERLRPVVDQLSRTQILLLPSTTMEGRDDRQQLETIW